MDAKNFFQKIFSGSKGTHTPTLVKERFNEQFEQPINVEWIKTGDQFEAVFYKDELENIARYSANGEMTCLKVNLPLDRVPENIAAAAKLHGELMNAIMIECEKSVKFELIVRDEALNRYFLLLSPNGEVSEKEKL